MNGERNRKRMVAKLIIFGDRYARGAGLGRGGAAWAAGQAQWCWTISSRLSRKVSIQSWSVP